MFVKRVRKMPFYESQILTDVIFIQRGVPHLCILCMIGSHRMTIDDTIARQARQEINDAPGLAFSTIIVSVTGGDVMLSGRVEDETQQLLAVRLVEKIHGVKKVDTTLRYEKADKDFILKKKAEKLLKARIEIPLHRLAVSVSGNRITLTGVVKWNYQKEAALCTASMLGEGSTVVDAIEVDPSSGDGIGKEAVMSALETQSNVNCEEIDVAVSDGVVILLGSVPDMSKKVELEEITRGLIGVRQVKNALVVR